MKVFIALLKSYNERYFKTNVTMFKVWLKNFISKSSFWKFETWSWNQELNMRHMIENKEGFMLFVALFYLYLWGLSDFQY